MKASFSLIFLLFFTVFSYGQETKYQIKTIAFYNVENLFDTINDPTTFDEASPIMESKGNRSEAYWKKIENTAQVIAGIGKEKTHESPAIIGICEVENRAVIEDLIHNQHLKDSRYGIVHYDSPDERSIDVALLYQKKYFKLLSHKRYELELYDTDGKRDYTRDQLLVSGYLDDELIHLIVSHWPSRSGGEARSRSKREAAAALNANIIKEIQSQYTDAKIITMGDLNDDPTNSSIKKVLGAKGKKSALSKNGLYNPMEGMFLRGLNTLGYRDNINLFDQIIISAPLLATDKTYKDYKMYQANIYNPRFLTNKKGRYKGYPYRSWSYGNFTGGYSDHYPVYLYLIKAL
ncbi:MAG: endonuclease/exonuclease/phosphatase family protein [Lutibacter sp.]|jgi:hypothetical protein|nr:endonuclease/exonuclease/phosphatase family protein [Lutibacter sp.]